MINYLNIEDEKKLANSLYYSGGYTKYNEGGWLERGTSWKGEDTGGMVSAGATGASALIGAFDDDPGYGGADVAQESLKYASMGAAAGPIGAGVGALVGAGIGFVKKGKYKKEKEKAEKKLRAEEDLAEYMQVKGDDYDAYLKDGGVINKYNVGGSIGGGVARKAAKEGTLTSVNEEGIHTFSDSMMDEITLTDKDPDRNRAAQNKLYESNPLAQNVHAATDTAASNVLTAATYHPAVGGTLGAGAKILPKVGGALKLGIKGLFKGKKAMAGYDTVQAVMEDGGIVQYDKGGETDSVKKADHTKNEELVAIKEAQKNKPGRDVEIKNAVESGYSNLYTEKEIADAIDPMTAYITKKRENMSPEQISEIENTGSIKEDKGLWDEDKGMIWNARNLLDKAVTGFQNASLRPGGSGGKKNVVATAVSEMFALPSINRLIKPDGDLEHIAHDPSDAKAWAHAGLNVIGAAPGTSLVSKGIRSKAGQIIPQVKGIATKTVDKVSDFASSLMGEKTVEALGVAAPWLHKAEKVAHQGHRADEVRKSMATGGMTPGAYNHATNPLAVVDKQGKHTGMELTGGEGVFDKPAMDKIKKLLKGGRFDEVGSFVNNEMKTWKHK